MRYLLRIAAIVACAACGCSKGTTIVTDDAVVTVEQRDGKAVIRSRQTDGAVTTFSPGGVTLPDEFKGIPLYPGAVPFMHGAVKDARSVVFVTSDPAVKIIAFYREKLKAEGWKHEAEAARGGHASLTSTNDNQKLTVVAAGEGEGTHLILTLDAKD